mmetsp:Transcript_30696/g.30217  ORF Transcript_30696/g.30217 Transcript_30696/m.30217 type:complete len:99 (+) Transcript_30696:320-616(+)
MYEVVVGQQRCEVEESKDLFGQITLLLKHYLTWRHGHDIGSPHIRDKHNGKVFKNNILNKGKKSGKKSMHSDEESTICNQTNNKYFLNSQPYHGHLPI